MLYLNVLHDMVSQNSLNFFSETTIIVLEINVMIVEEN